MKKRNLNCARQLRKNSTREEKILWNFLKNRRFMNLKFRRQHVINGFVLDFYCADLKLAIEIDGPIHDNRKEYDEERQHLIEQRGLYFIRVSNCVVTNNLNYVFERIQEHLLQNY
jgi:very-short-patch-repair endonuclease